jgi:hypothetical protein
MVQYEGSFLPHRIPTRNVIKSLCPTKTVLTVRDRNMNKSNDANNSLGALKHLSTPFTRVGS